MLLSDYLIFFKMSDELQTIVIDYGSFKCKAGFWGDDEPKLVIPSMVGVNKFCKTKDLYVGEKALNAIGILQVQFPIENGIVTNWDQMEEVYDHVFHELKANSSEHPVLLTEVPQVSKGNREKMIQIMFETFNVPSFYVGIQAALSIWASGNNTGLVIDIGDSLRQIVPVYEGYAIPSNAYKDNIAGKLVTQELRRLLIDERNCNNYRLETINDIKEKFAYVAFDLDKELEKSKNQDDLSYFKPDGDNLYLNNERFRCTEVLFNSFQNFVKKMIDAIMNVEFDIRNDISSNVVVCGGTSSTNGFIERFEKEMNSNQISKGFGLKINALPDRKYQVWQGSSILAFTSAFKDMLVTHEEYNDAGAQIVNRKCF